MSLVDDIVRAQVKPKAVLNEQFSTSENEILTLALALVFGLLCFITAIPQFVVMSQETGNPLSSFLLPLAFGTFGLVPLALYAVAGLARLCGKLFGGRGTSARSRRGLVWSLIASTPWMLLSGILSETGFLGIALSIVAAAIFLIHWFIAIYLNEIAS